MVGKKEAIEQVRTNPLMRALRCDKLTYAALEATLKLFRGNQIKASKCLGFNRNTLRTKINIYGIEVLKKRKL